MVDELDEASLLAAAARAGVTVSSHQLKRWRRAGLMPRPRIEHAPGLRGSRACIRDGPSRSSWRSPGLTARSTVSRRCPSRCGGTATRLRRSRCAMP
jgi:hypothetical protein